ncbi:MAG: FtsK/SpoIIIE domain-containing protein, partial [Pseudonocardiales bacterium]
MELELLVDDGPGAAPRGVLVEFRDGATVGELRQALASSSEGRHQYPGTDTGQLYGGNQPLPDALPLTDAGLLDGQFVSFSRGAAPVRAPDAGLRVAVAGGLHAGPVIGIWPGWLLTVGRAAGCDLRVTDDEVSRQHAAFWQESQGGVLSVRDAGSRNGIRRRGRLLAGDTPLGVGDVLGIGESVLEVVATEPVPADITRGVVPGTRAFNRPPRIAEPWQRPELTVPAEPAKPRGFRFPWIAIAIPLLLGAVMYFVLPAQYAKYIIIMILISPLMMLGNTIGDRRSGRKDYSAKLAEYRKARTAFDLYLAAVADADERRSRYAAPDPAEVVRRAMLPAATLWQRRSRDEEFLRLRLGLVDRPADIGLHPSGHDQPVPNPPTVYDVPVTVDLRTAGVLGVSGTRPVVLAAARSLVTQAAVLHAPGELAIAVITGADSAPDWEWASWLPHVRPWSSALACQRLLATDAAQAAARVAELLELVDERASERRSMLADGPPPGRAVLVVLDGARRLRGVPGLAALLAAGPSVGVYTVCFDGEETALPDECQATLVAALQAPSRAMVRRPGMMPAEDVLIDGLSLPQAILAAQALTPIRVLGGGGGDAELPERVRFTELAGLRIDADAVRQAWNESPTGRSSRALIGVSSDGPLTVDLVKDGPHALVTGTSGAGKSELLQTLVASLALANTPDALTFVLVDYKGGSAFGPCAELPHCVGMVTDLDGHLVSRALDSLSAELRRREGLFAEAGAKDIDDYWARTGARLPRLVIVVDEFASLVEEIPDFVPGVVGIGMRGRSLGVHVVLATQRPGGVVTADMRANVNLRISLRVTSDAESNDVIDSPVAARIPGRQPGRAYLRTGHRELTAFQAARIGWPVDDHIASDAPPVSVLPRLVDLLGFPLERGSRSDVDEHGHTDLTDLVTAIQQAATDAGIAAPSRPWLPPLPEDVPLATLDVPTSGPAVAVIGLVDRPSAQAQDPFVLDLAVTGPVVIAGAARSGRSTALRTIAASLANSSSPADLHLYALDCGNHALAALADLPHCGAVVDGADPARTERLLDMLTGEVNRRQVLLGAGGHGSIAEQRAAVAAA